MARQQNWTRRFRLALAATALALTPLAAVPALLAGTASAAGTYGPHAPALTENTTVVGPGGADTLHFHGAYPGEFFHVYIHSAGVLIGTATADSRGDFTLDVVIPSYLPLGHHTITAVGNEGDVLSVPIEIVATSPAPAAVTPTAGGTPATTGSGLLASTGADVVATTGVGAAAVAVGGLIVLGARRRRRPAWRG